MMLLLALALGSASPHSKPSPHGAAKAATHRAGQPQPADAAPPPAAAALMKTCSAHKFETVVETTVGGQKRRSTVKLCGEPGQTDAQWKRTLEDAAGKIATNATMSADMKSQITSALKAEIAKVGSAPSAASAAIVPLLPSRESQPVVVVPTLGLPDPIVMRTPPVAPAPVMHAASPAPPALAPWTKPRLGISCYTPGDLAEDGPCTIVESDTVVTLRAGENTAAGMNLRFIRGGGFSSEIGLPALAKNKSLRVPLPSDICAHVSGGELRLQLVRNADGQAIDVAGPFLLRC